MTEPPVVSEGIGRLPYPVKGVVNRCLDPSLGDEASRNGGLQFPDGGETTGCPPSLPPVCVPRGESFAPSIFLEPFAPPELPGFNATMVPLTPDRISPPVRSLCFMNQTVRTFRLQPPPVARDTMSLCFMSRSSQRPKPCSSVFMAHRLRHYPAGSPRQQAESSSLAFRTIRSPSDALHPASRRRSFGRLQDQTLSS